MTKKPASYEDLEALPPDVVGEIIAGELYASPRPATPHARVAYRLGIATSPFDRDSDGPGGWVFLPEPELHLGRDVLVPDLAGWRCERMPWVPPAPVVKLAPDWLCEISSPSTEKYDRGLKLLAYAREQVRHVWLIDPEARRLEVLGLEGPRYVPLATHVGDVTVRAEPFGLLELELGRFWRAYQQGPRK
jgi:Uma2 family endonuclease